MNCIFCQQTISEFQECNSEWGDASSRIYKCKLCKTAFTQEVIYKKEYTNFMETDWRWVPTEQEELHYYQMTLNDYEIECFVHCNGPFVVRRWDKDHKFIWVVCKLPYIPPHVHPSNLVDRIKTWVLFS